MANPLLDRATPEQLARRKQAIEIVENLSTFERLAAIVEADLGALAADKRPSSWRALPVNLGLQFGWADARERLPRLTGTASVALPAVCQRCLEPCTVALQVSLELLLLAAGDVQSVDDALDVWELSEDTLRPIDVVEEMLVMALPMAATHPSREECGALAGYMHEATTDTVRPFAGLKAELDKPR